MLLAIMEKIACFVWGHDYLKYTKHTLVCEFCGKTAPNLTAIGKMLKEEVDFFERAAPDER